MYGLEQIKNTLDKQELDIRQTHNARWIDQKCTPDVVCANADIISTVCTKDPYNPDYDPSFNPNGFTAKDVWLSKYSINYIPMIFDKPKPSDNDAKAEYNKFFQQSLNMFSYAGILDEYKKGHTNYYKIMDIKSLQFIGMKDLNALRFLVIYITDVLKHSGLYNNFLKFFNKQTQSTFEDNKKAFVNFTIKNTRINKPLEPRRIFSKVLNPLAQANDKLGTKHGYMSHEPISYGSLMYNSKNFRDMFSKKPKDISRKQWLADHPISKSHKAKINYDTAKAKRLVREINNEFFEGKSELHDSHASGPAVHMHHMFPRSEFPELSAVVENIIAITPTQHLSYAHPKGNTHEISTSYQEKLLKAKASTIQYVIEHDSQIPQIYHFDKFDYVLNDGFGHKDTSINKQANYKTTINKIINHYSSTK